MNLRTILASTVVSALLCACGGGGGDAPTAYEQQSSRAAFLHNSNLSIETALGTALPADRPALVAQFNANVTEYQSLMTEARTPPCGTIKGRPAEYQACEDEWARVFTPLSS